MSRAPGASWKPWLVGAVGLAACLAWALVRARTGAQELLDRMAQMAAQPDGFRFTMADLQPGPWDRVCIVAPYTSRAEFRRTAGMEWPGGLLRIPDADSQQALVFLDAERVAAAAVLPRVQGDFVHGRAPQVRVLQRDKATFEVVTTPGAWKVFHRP